MKKMMLGWSKKLREENASPSPLLFETLQKEFEKDQKFAHIFSEENKSKWFVQSPVSFMYSRLGLCLFFVSTVLLPIFCLHFFRDHLAANALLVFSFLFPTLPLFWAGLTAVEIRHDLVRCEYPPNEKSRQDLLLYIKNSTLSLSQKNNLTNFVRENINVAFFEKIQKAVLDVQLKTEPLSLDGEVFVQDTAPHEREFLVISTPPKISGLSE